jgi:hypothetical protein
MQVQTRPFELGRKIETLDHAIEAIRVRFGSQALTRVAELPPPLPWPSGTPLDRLTGIGGLPRGRLTLLTGTGTCGKLTLALALLAQATREFAHAVVVDPARQFDPWTMLPFQPELSTLTLVRAPDLDAAGEAAAALARAGSGFILLMGEVPEPWLGPMEAGAGRSGAVVVGVVDSPGRAFAHASSLSFGFARVGWIHERGQLIGVTAEARVAKNKLAPAVGESELEIRYPIGTLPISSPLVGMSAQSAVWGRQINESGESECASAAV